MLELKVAHESWPLRQAFTISRGSRTSAEVVTVELRDREHRGRGECVPYRRYGESLESVQDQIERMRPALQEGISRSALATELPPGAARNALDCALIDLECKRTNRRAWDLLHLREPEPVVTAQTLSLDGPREMGEEAARHADHPLLKLKLDGDLVVERVYSVRERAPRARLIVDANESWSHELLVELIPPLHQLGVEMIEQPLRAGRDHELEGFHSPIPLCADESCHTANDIAGLVDRYQMVNLKLDKTGGLTEAVEFAARARSHGLELMVGCMVGTSLGMAPATLLTSQARVVDLDGPLWMREDRPHGLSYDGFQVHRPTAALWG